METEEERAETSDDIVIKDVSIEMQQLQSRQFSVGEMRQVFHIPSRKIPNRIWFVYLSSGTWHTGRKGMAYLGWKF